MPSSSQVPSKASTRSSRAAVKAPLEPILEGLISSSDTEDSESHSMASPSSKQEGSLFVDLLGHPTTALVYDI